MRGGVLKIELMLVFCRAEDFWAAAYSLPYCTACVFASEKQLNDNIPEKKHYDAAA